jgi:hypothetical protein
MSTLTSTEQVVSKCQDLFEWPIFGVTREVIDAREFETILGTEGFYVFCIDQQLKEPIRTKESLMNAMASACNFPNYFGKTWDALKDCLCGLYALPEKPKGIVLFFGQIPRLSWTDVASFFNIVEALRWIHIKNDVSFRLFIPEELERDESKALAEKNARLG